MSSACPNFRVDRLPQTVIFKSKKINRVYAKTPPAVRFWAKVEKTNTCWNWLGGLTERGYGSFDGRRAHTWIAHNVMHVRPNHKMVIDHKCRNKRCVRPHPKHLRLVTQRVNLMNSDGWKGSRTHCSKGHLLSGDNLYLWGGHRYCRACRSSYLKQRRKRK